MWLAAATLQIRSCLLLYWEDYELTQLTMWDSTWVDVFPCQMNPNPSPWWASIWLAKRCSTCSDFRVQIYIAWCAITWERDRVIKKRTSSCLWKVTRILKLQTLYQALERTAGHSPETSGGWPEDCACNKILDVLTCTTQIPHPCTRT